MVESNDPSDLYDRGLLDAGVSACLHVPSLTSDSAEGLKSGPTSSSDLVSIPRLFRDFGSRSEPVKICAPMVRYSKLAFRRLVRKYGADLCFTPMIVADAFIKSVKGVARGRVRGEMVWRLRLFIFRSRNVCVFAPRSLDFSNCCLLVL